MLRWSGHDFEDWVEWSQGVSMSGFGVVLWVFELDFLWYIYVMMLPMYFCLDNQGMCSGGSKVFKIGNQISREQENKCRGCFLKLFKFCVVINSRLWYNSCYKCNIVAFITRSFIRDEVEWIAVCIIVS